MALRTVNGSSIDLPRPFGPTFSSPRGIADMAHDFGELFEGVGGREYEQNGIEECLSQQAMKPPQGQSTRMLFCLHRGESRERR